MFRFGTFIHSLLICGGFVFVDAVSQAKSSPAAGFQITLMIYIYQNLTSRSIAAFTQPIH